MATIKNIMRSELIGLNIRTETKNAPRTVLHGTIRDETKHLLILETATGMKRLVKKNIILTIKNGEKEQRIDGAFLHASSIDRIKINVNKMK